MGHFLSKIYLVWRTVSRTAEWVFWAAGYILYNCVYKFSHVCACFQVKIISVDFVYNSICIMTDSYFTGPNYSDRVFQSFIQITAILQPLCSSPPITGGELHYNQENVTFHHMLCRNEISFSIHMPMGNKEDKHIVF